MLYGNNVVLSTCQTFRFLCLDQTLFFSVASLYVIYLWHHSCLMLYVLAKPGRLLGNAVATESIDLVLDGQVLCLLVLVSCDIQRMRIITQAFHSWFYDIVISGFAYFALVCFAF